MVKVARGGARPRDGAGRTPRHGSGRGTIVLLVFLVALGAAGCRPAAPALPAPPGPTAAHGDGAAGPAAKAAPDRGPFFYHGQAYGTDAYAGPLDVLFNKGFAIAQWEGRGRNLFTYQYGWGALRGTLEHPGPLVQQAGGWKEVLRWQAVPFAEGNFNDAQWVPNYFGHIVEGGIVYRRLREWNEAHGVPLPSVMAGLVTYASALVNEAYEMPRGEPGAENGTAGSVVDLYIFDPLGVLFFQQDFVARFFAHWLHGALWPTQASVTLTDGLLMNNGESIVFKPPIPFTDKARLFLRAGMGVEGGLSVRRGDGIDVSVAVGEQSRQRWLNPYTALEYAQFGLSASVWLDRDGILLAGLTWDQGTDRRIGLNIYPGFARVGGTELGGWFVLDSTGRPYLGITTSRTLGAGLGIGF